MQQLALAAKPFNHGVSKRCYSFTKESLPYPYPHGQFTPPFYTAKFCRQNSTVPDSRLHLLKTKAEEAGSLWVDVPTRLVKPSQTCHRCGIQRKKTLAEREHRCGCGASCSRDENAARVMLNWALHGNATGRESVRGGESLLFDDVEPRNSTYTALAA